MVCDTGDDLPSVKPGLWTLDRGLNCGLKFRCAARMTTISRCELDIRDEHGSMSPRLGTALVSTGALHAGVMQVADGSVQTTGNNPS